MSTTKLCQKNLKQLRVLKQSFENKTQPGSKREIKTEKVVYTN